MLKGMFMEFRIERRDTAAWLLAPLSILAQVESEESQATTIFGQTVPKRNGPVQTTKRCNSDASTL
jgi:hypothetical protein